ncbi:MAG: hypothetical protein ACJAUV_000189 [Flavobacteriales bacterium]|jgi:uncharacterized protein (TIGR00255 family)
MLQSMTGYGKAVSVINNKKFTVEVKSLNSKQLDLTIKMPSLYREKELLLRNKLAVELERGKVEIGIFYEANETEKKASINKELLKTYYTDLAEVANELDLMDKGALLSSLLKMPDILKTERPELNENEWNEIEQLVMQSIARFKTFREEEGARLEKDLTMRVNQILTLLTEVEKLAPERAETIKERINQHMVEAIGKEQIDQNRFEQEMIYYLEKYDITEEVVRLGGHCQYFFETAKDAGQQGKKLGFITQEMGREINTTGSKANHAGIQKAVVQMKDELEKIKEQLLNIL